MPDYVVILGAKVRQDGSPSASLARRIEGALLLAKGLFQPVFLASGGVGDHPPAEAVVVRDELVKRGVPDAHIVLDAHSRDTLESVLRCSRILREAPDTTSVTVCTDRFHVLRTTALFRIAGIPARPGWIRSGRNELGTRKWIYYWIRDFVALLWDVPLVMWKSRHAIRGD